MMPRIPFAAVAGALILLVGAPRAQSAGTTGAEFLQAEVPAGTAALAAGVAKSGGIGAMDWNPAAILGQTDPAVAFTHFASFVDTAYEQLELIYPGWLEGNWGVRVFYASTYDFVILDDLGEATGTLDNHDLLLQAAYARPVAPGLSAGAALKVFESVLAEYSSHGAAVDLGLRYQTPWTPLALGAVLQNLGGMTAFESEADALPLGLRVGADLQVRPWGEHAVDLLADANLPLAGDDPVQMSLGLEYGFKEFLFLRGGYRFTDQLGALSLGAGLRWGNVGLDYAYQPFSDLGDNHRFTLIYQFKPPGEEPPVRTLSGGGRGPAMTVKKLAAMRQDVASITALPRLYGAKVVFLPPPGLHTPAGWRLDIRNARGETMRHFQGEGDAPREILWHGEDETGQQVSGEAQLSFAFYGPGAKVSRHDLPQLFPVYKLRFEDGAELEPEARFHFSHLPQVKDWNLSVWNQQSEEIVARFSQPQGMTAEWVWDGKTRLGTVASSRDTYRFGLDLTYPDGFKVLISEGLQAIPAAKVAAPEGQAGILIQNILFDFDRAELKPEMMDKILAACEILKRYPRAAAATCEGHADEIGSEAYNFDLSERRAHMVANYMGQQPGVSSGQLSVVGYGKTVPVDTSNTEAGRALNRRVEIRLTIPAL